MDRPSSRTNSSINSRGCGGKRRRNYSSIAIVTGIIFSMLAVAPAPTVGSLSVPGEYPTIQAAIDAAYAAGGGTVLVVPGEYVESIELKPGVRVLGAGAEVTILRGDGSTHTGATYTVLGADNSTISGFTITQSMVGIINHGSSPIISNNIIVGHLIGIRCSNYSSATVVNNLIVNNSSVGVISSNSSPRIVNNTIVSNDVGIYHHTSTAKIVNNIVAHNLTEGIYNDGEQPTMRHNNVWSNGINYSGCLPGPGDISADPMFVDPASRDYHLRRGSPSIDTGYNHPDLPGGDFDNNPRMVDGNGDDIVVVDMGAFEFQIPPPTTIYVDIANVTGLEDGTQHNPFNTIREAIDFAFPRDNILVAAGEYVESIKLKRDISLFGAGADVTIIRGDVSTWWFSYTVVGADNSTLSGFSITGSRFGIIGRGSFMTLTNNTVFGNTVGILNRGSSPLITRNIIKNNNVGIYNYQSSAAIANNLIGGNPIGIYSTSSSPKIVNNTIGRNDIGIYDRNSNSIILNNIIVCNAEEGIYGENSTSTINYNNIWGNGTNYVGCSPGTGNISANPLFIDPSAGNYHLRSDSPCIDAGYNHPALPKTDFDGNPRVVDGDNDGVAVVDMGACEFNPGLGPSGYEEPPAPPVVTIYVDDSNNSGIEDGTKEHPYNTIQEGIDAAPTGETTLVAPGEYYQAPTGIVIVAPGRYSLTSTIRMKQHLILRSAEGPEATVVYGRSIVPGAHYAIEAADNTIIEGFTIHGDSWGICAAGTDITITNNYIDGEGISQVGVYVGGRRITVTNNTITNHSGEGVWVAGGSDLTLANNIITRNAGYGGIYSRYSALILLNNIITHNSGPGIKVRESPSAKIVNNTILRNGAGIHIIQSTSKIGNNIIAGNQNEGIYSEGSSLTIGYNDVWYNGTNYVGSSPGPGDISTNPLFVDHVSGNYRLQAGSPCIDAGYNHPALPETDFDGNPRVVDGDKDGTAVVDMGAFEYYKNTPVGENVEVKVSANITAIFEQVTTEGDTSAETFTGGPPENRKLVPDNTYHDIKTTATYSGLITLIIHYDDQNLTGFEENSLMMVQWNQATNQWDNITTRVDTENNFVYGETTSLGRFALMIPIQDTTPPMTSCSLTGPEGNAGWWLGGVKVELTSTDDMSGVQYTVYRIDNGSWHTYAAPFEVSGNGVHLVEYYSVDGVQNIEPTNSVEIKIDDLPPEISSPTTSPSFITRGDSVEISVVVGDLSGVASVSAVIAQPDGVTENMTLEPAGENSFNGLFTTTSTDPTGEYLVSIKAEDVAGNTSTADGQPFPVVEYINGIPVAAYDVVLPLGKTLADFIVTDKATLNEPLIIQHAEIRDIMEFNKVTTHAQIRVENTILNSGPLVFKNSLINAPVVFDNVVMNASVIFETTTVNTKVSFLDKEINAEIKFKKTTINLPFTDPGIMEIELLFDSSTLNGEVNLSNLRGSAKILVVKTEVNAPLTLKDLVMEGDLKITESVLNSSLSIERSTLEAEIDIYQVTTEEPITIMESEIAVKLVICGVQLTEPIEVIGQRLEDVGSLGVRIDGLPPEITVLTATPDVLWPPNHKMVEVRITVVAEDRADPNPRVELIGVASSEPDDGRGDGHTTGDIQKAKIGTFDTSIRLRAERDGRETERVYTITYRATDYAGNSSERSVSVIVPHDMGKVKQSQYGLPERTRFGL